MMLVDIVVITLTFVLLQITIGFSHIENLCGTAANLLMRACPDVELIIFFIAGIVITR